MSETFQSSRFKYLSDPPVLSRPFGIEIDQDKCIGCGVCIKQCPCQTVEMVKRAAPSEKQQPACQYACPAGIDIRGYMDALSNGGSFEDAWNIITRTNPMPAITGRVCSHPCETSCNRNYLDEALNINGMERFVGDFGIENKLSFVKPPTGKKEKIAVVGAGPSGMSCAYHLAKEGYKVTVFEANENPGGMLRYAIPRYRLPDDIIDHEMNRIIDLGIEVNYNTRVGKDVTIDEIKKDFKSVYLAVGAQRSAALNVKGEDAKNVYPGLDLLRQMADRKKVELGRNVAVIGGGNTAIDAARAARRMGSDVTVLYRRTLNEMPAYPLEIEEARNEGVKIEFLCAPVQINTDGNGKAGSVTCTRMELGKNDTSGRPSPVAVKGSEFTMDLDSLICAVGQKVDPLGVDALVDKSGWIKTDVHGMTAEQGFFAGGDVSLGLGTVSEAIGEGKRAALAIDAYLRGTKLPELTMTEIIYKDIPLDDHAKAARNETTMLAANERMISPDAQVNLPLSGDQVLDEGKRCLSCGMLVPKFTGIQYFGKICIACHNCEAVCPNEALSFPHYYKITEGRFAHDFDYPKEKGEGFPNPLKKAKTPAFSTIQEQITDVEKVIYTRRSTRVYKKDAVPKEMIERILEAGRFAPSAGNCQGWKFVVLTDQGLMSEISVSALKFLNLFTKLYQGKDPLRTSVKKTLPFVKPEGCDQRPMVAMQALITPKFGDKKLSVFFDAPAAILLLTHHHHISDPALGMGICAQNMVLAAHSLGLGTCYVGFVSTALNMDPFTKKKFRSKLGIEWPYDSVGTVITLGYPAVKIDKPVEREFPRIQWVE